MCRLLQAFFDILASELANILDSICENERIPNDRLGSLAASTHRKLIRAYETHERISIASMAYAGYLVCVENAHLRIIGVSDPLRFLSTTVLCSFRFCDIGTPTKCPLFPSFLIWKLLSLCLTAQISSTIFQCNLAVFTNNRTRMA